MANTITVRTNQIRDVGLYGATILGWIRRAAVAQTTAAPRISTGACAQDLGLPWNEVKRHLHALAERGYCKIRCLGGQGTLYRVTLL